MEKSSAGSGCLTPDDSSTSFTDGGKSFAKFERCLKGWEAYEKAATSAEPHWFKDLLSLWCPSGHPSGTTGLRIAIRNEYLNFYRLGQSVARVYCVSGALAADVHYKYVLDEPLPGMSKSPYLRLTKEGVSFRGELVAAYEGLSTLLKWVAVAGEEKYAGVEKTIVEKLVEKNDHVIDLEMALPAWVRSESAVWVRYSGVAHFDYYIWPTWVVILCIILPVLV